MAKLLNQVTIPELPNLAFTETLHSVEEIEYAKLLIILKNTEKETARVHKLLSEDVVSKIKQLIESGNLINHGLSVEGSKKEIPDFLTVRDVSQLAGITPQQVRRNCINGKYQAHQVAGENSSWRISPLQFKDLPNWENFLQKRKEKFHNNKMAAELGVSLWKDQINDITIKED